MWDNWFWKVVDGTRTVWRHQGQDNCSLLFHCCMWQQLTRRSQVMTSHHIIVPCTSTQRGLINIWSSGLTWTQNQNLHQSGNWKVLLCCVQEIDLPNHIYIYINILYHFSNCFRFIFRNYYHYFCLPWL